VVKRAHSYAVVAALVVGIALGSIVFLQPRQAPSTSQTSTATTARASSPKFFEVTVGTVGTGDDATFNPSIIRVEIGVNNTVVWSNSDTIVHTVTSTNLTASGAPLFNSGDMGQGAEFSYTFVKPGTYPYMCIYHGQMVGEVIVEAQMAG
jgi:plastocyanin